MKIRGGFVSNSSSSSFIVSSERDIAECARRSILLYSIDSMIEAIEHAKIELPGFMFDATGLSYQQAELLDLQQKYGIKPVYITEPLDRDQNADFGELFTDGVYQGDL